MALLSLSCTAVFAAVAVGGRAWLHVRRTGASPLRGGAGVGGVGALVGNGVAFVGGPVIDLATGRGRLLHGPAPAAGGLVLVAAGLALTTWSQAAMGDAWRIGVDPGERTSLVTDGPFRWVRNPIYTAMIAFAAGLTLLVPNVVAIGGLVFVAGALEVHVRHVEEPHLAGAFAAAYTAYAGRVGRFVPRVGRLTG